MDAFCFDQQGKLIPCWSEHPCPLSICRMDTVQARSALWAVGCKPPLLSIYFRSNRNGNGSPSVWFLEDRIGGRCLERKKSVYAHWSIGVNRLFAQVCLKNWQADLFGMVMWKGLKALFTWVMMSVSVIGMFLLCFNFQVLLEERGWS